MLSGLECHKIGNSPTALSWQASIRPSYGLSDTVGVGPERSSKVYEAAISRYEACQIQHSTTSISLQFVVVGEVPARIHLPMLVAESFRVSFLHNWESEQGDY